MSEARYTAFTRTWWKPNPDWPNGREPSPGRKRALGRDLTESEAQALCREWNAENKPGKMSRKAEYEAQ